MRRRSRLPVQPSGRRLWLGLDRWQFEHATAANLIPGPDTASGKWSAAAARTIAGRLAEIVAQIGSEHPIGARRAADRMAQRTGLYVSPLDVEVLVERGLLSAADRCKGHPLYAVQHLDAVAPEALAALVAEREA